jgi:hypothetical protein
MLDHRPKRPSDTAAASPATKRARDPSTPSFPMYKDAPDLPPKICLLCEILASDSIVVETSAALDDTDVRITTTDVERVLRFSYTHARMRFCRLLPVGGPPAPRPRALPLHVESRRGHPRQEPPFRPHVGHRHLNAVSGPAILCHIRLRVLLSCSSPLKAFVDMPRYGMERDTPVLNSLLSALCHTNLLNDARMAIPMVHAKASTHLDADSRPSSLKAVRLPRTCRLPARCWMEWCAPLALILPMCLHMTHS